MTRGASPDPDLIMPDRSPQFHATPAGVNPSHDYSRDVILRSLDDSLQRLRIERVDYVHIHDPDDYIVQAIGEAFQTLAELRAQGPIGAIGVSTKWSAVGLAMARECDLDCLMLTGRYSLLDREGLAELLPLCERRCISVLVGGVFNSGFLANPKPGGMFQYRPCYDDTLIARAVPDQGCCCFRTASRSRPLPSSFRSGTRRCQLWCSERGRLSMQRRSSTCSSGPCPMIHGCS
jgi:hypothetical protein